VNAVERVAWLAFNANTNPGDRITLYRARGFEITTREYRADEHRVFRLVDQSDDGVTRWPYALTSPDLERLGRGWALRGGIAVTRDLALRAEAHAMRKRVDSLKWQLHDAEACVATLRERGYE
jgi:hypothetical protein